MKLDSDWELLSRDWVADTPQLPSLKARVQRESRNMRWIVASEVLVTIVIGGGSTLWAALARDSAFVVLAAAVWVFIATAWAFGLVARKGAWEAAGSDTASYLDLSIRRCQVSIASAYFGIALCLVEVGFCLAWVYRYLSRTQQLSPVEFLTSSSVFPFLLATLAVVGGCLWYRRKRANEMEGLINFKRQMMEDVEYNRSV